MLYARPPPIVVAPTTIGLNADSRCKCGSGYDPNQPSTIQPCTIYGLLKSYSSNIELQACPSCPTSKHRSIGPETRYLGLFNFNGRILVAHDLLDEYTSAYTCSETPFVAWVTTAARRYMVHLSERPFLSPDMFRSVWFSYARLQCLEGDMECPKCGPSPETVIWDGVTLAFSRKHILSSLQPPTTLHVDSPIRDRCRYYPNQQLLEDVALRRLVRSVLSGPLLPVDLLDEHAGESQGNLKDLEQGESEAKGSKSKERSQVAAGALDQIKRITSAHSQLKMINKALASIFETYFGVQAYTLGHKAPSALRALFVQVRTVTIFDVSPK
jgi:hypothetical protein